MLMQTGFEVSAPPMLLPLGPALDAVVAVMAEEGWSYPVASRAVEAVTANAGLGRTRARTAGGWRTLAEATGLPPWQIRRLTVLLCGAPGWRGLIDAMVETGHDVLRHAGYAALSEQPWIDAHPRRTATPSQACRVNPMAKRCSKLVERESTPTVMFVVGYVVAAFFGAGAFAFVFDVADGQPQELDHGVVVGEVPPVFDDLAELVVQRLDRVGGVDDPPHLGWDARNGVNRSQARSHTATAPGQRRPMLESANAPNASSAASSVGAV
jgi:hypothetical protein